MASIFLFGGVLGMAINALAGRTQMLPIYICYDICLPFVILLNYLHKDKIARILLAFYPGIAFFVTSLFIGKILPGERESYFLMMMLNSLLPMLLFSDTEEKWLFIMGCVYYLVIILLFDQILKFEKYYEIVNTLTKIKEICFYVILVSGFAIKLAQRTAIEKELKIKNSDLLIQKDEIEVLLEEVQSQKEELSIQQETLFIQNSQLTLQRDELVNINERLEKNNDALLQLASEQILTNGNYEEALKIITQIAATTLGVSRVSVWEIRENKDSIHCIDMYSLSSDQHSCGMELFSSDFPVYFNAINANKTIVANDASTNIFTSEFKDKYLIPLQIVSMLDSPFFIDGDLKGIVCFEQQNETRKWTPEDIMFSRAIADLVPLSFESAQRKLAQKEIIEQNNLLIIKQQEILELNEQLEGKVKQRTEQLELRNKLLEEYAFYNSHVLRAPLCSLQGLIELSNHDKNFVINEQYIHHLKNALLDMEVITKEVAEKLRIADSL
jgi:hypothetical protein